MQKFATFAVIAIIVLMLGVVPGQASPASREVSAAAQEIAQETIQEISAQSRTYRRPRTQLRVYPRYPRRNFHALYPLPYAIEYPGPFAVRQCVSRLAQERRPSGTVIVPRMRCWWARG
jgi:uncharacterized membrane protein